MIKIAPSILSADFSRLGEEVRRAGEAGADYIHVDVMDGHFVPNLTFGHGVVKALRPHTRLPLDVHLMIQHPERFVVHYREAGADILTVHLEAEGDLPKTLKAIADSGMKVGLALKPLTPLPAAAHYLGAIDLLVIMTVEPGFGGQKFMPSVLPKIREARRAIDAQGVEVELEVDGGVNPEWAPKVAAAGARVLVAGSAVYGGDVKANVTALRKSAGENT
jgi:ribulose-phosphate 3-epimerase